MAKPHGVMGGRHGTQDYRDGTDASGKPASAETLAKRRAWEKERLEKARQQMAKPKGAFHIVGTEYKGKGTQPTAKTKDKKEKSGGVFESIKDQQFMGEPLNRGAKVRGTPPFSQTLFGTRYDPHNAMIGLKQRFVMPPFSVLNARDGLWQARKRVWATLGIRGEAGRGDTQAVDEMSVGDSSVFDPVLCELMYRWFCPPGGHVFDPFAGESTKGIVAAYLGYGYTGIELRQVQVDANYAQAKRVQFPGAGPDWIQGDSATIPNMLPAIGDPNYRKYDFLWTSPPYYDLEIYSKKETDGSAFATYEQFIEWYRHIFKKSVRRLADNRFVAVKVGEVRDKKTGAYRNFVGDNIKCFVDCGLTYYNEIILVTAVGSLPVRTGKAFNVSRKVGKTHQNVLVFWKGDPEHIKENFPAYEE